MAGDLLTVEELADYLKMGVSTVYRLAQSGKIPGRKIGRQWRFRRITIYDWLDQKGKTFRTPISVIDGSAEPELYVKLGRGYISLEVPPPIASRVIENLAVSLQAESIVLRFDVDGTSKELRCIPATLPQMLRRYASLIQEEPVIIEYGSSTLYSNGGGCLLLETSVNDATKRKIAQQILELCGYLYRVKSNRFTALARLGKLEVIKP